MTSGVRFHGVTGLLRVRSVSAAFLLIASTCLSSTFAADDAPEFEAPDHPLIVLVGASLDRVLDRAVEVMHVAGMETTRAEVAKLVQSEGDADSFANTEKWFDFTRPVGLMFFFRLESVVEVPQAEPIGVDKNVTESNAAEKKGREEIQLPQQAVRTEVPGIFELANMFDDVDLSHVVVFLPVKDYPQFLALNKLAPVPDKPFCFQDDKGSQSYLRRSGDYVLGATMPGLVENCPDPRGLARTVLGKNDAAVSLQLKGLPPLLRTLGAEGIKAAYDASLQQRDAEPEREYQLRRVTGDLIRELLDLTVSHTDQITLGVRFDPQSSQTIFDLDFDGEKGGELAKVAAEMTPRRLPFAGLGNAESGASLEIALPLPERHSKPIAAAIRNYVATAIEPEASLLKTYSPLIESGCKILDSRQLDIVMTDSDGTGRTAVIGIAAPSGARFPQQFQQFLESRKDLQVTLAVDDYHGVPVHRLEKAGGVTLLGLFSDGMLEAPSSAGSGDYWIVATPQAIWISAAPTRSEGRMPETLKSAMETFGRRPANPQKSPRGNQSFRMVLHTRHWLDGELAEPQPNIEEDEQQRVRRQEQLEKGRQQREELVSLYQDKSDAVSAGLTSTPTGWRFSIQLDEVYLPLLYRSLVE